jgi:hypothetical protein
MTSLAKNHIPLVRVLHLKNFDDYRDIVTYCQNHNIRFMLYRIWWKNRLIKIGIQWKQGANTEHGERLYDQAGWMPGWPKPCLRRSPATGRATLALIKNAESRYKDKFHKDDVRLEIEDYTDYPFLCAGNIYPEMQNREEEAKEKHFKKHKCFPIGNLKQERIRRVVPDKTFSDLFEMA